MRKVKQQCSISLHVIASAYKWYVRWFHASEQNISTYFYKSGETQPCQS